MPPFWASLKRSRVHHRTAGVNRNAPVVGQPVENPPSVGGSSTNRAVNGTGVENPTWVDGFSTDRPLSRLRLVDSGEVGPAGRAEAVDAIGADQQRLDAARSLEVHHTVGPDVAHGLLEGNRDLRIGGCKERAVGDRGRLARR